MRGRNRVVKKADQQKHGQSHGQRRMHDRQNDASRLQREDRKNGDKGKGTVANSLTEQAKSPYKVVEIIQQLNKPFHDSPSADDGKYRAGFLPVTAPGFAIVIRRVIRLLGVGDGPME